MKHSRKQAIPYLIFRTILVLLILLIYLSMTGCGDDRFTATTSISKFEELYAQQQNQQVPDNTTDIMPLMMESEDSDYLLGAGDLVSIKVLETDQLNTEARVSAKGVINVPLLGSVEVANLSATELEKKLVYLYSQDYIRDPHVAVRIIEHRSKQITLVGAVMKPGTYEYVSRRRLLDVLALGNGLSPDASSSAFITRTDPKTNQVFNYVVDLDDLIKNGNMAKNYIIKGKDVIFIPKTGQCFVDGAVRKPGTYPLTSNMTITEAIALAGGLAGYADEDSIKLIRSAGRGKARQVVSISINDIQSGLGDKIILKDQDIIFAESSSFGKFVSGTGVTLGFLGTGVTYRDPEQ